MSREGCPRYVSLQMICTPRFCINMTDQLAEGKCLKERFVQFLAYHDKINNKGGSLYDPLLRASNPIERFPEWIPT